MESIWMGTPSGAYISSAAIDWVGAVLAENGQFSYTLNKFGIGNPFYISTATYPTYLAACQAFGALVAGLGITFQDVTLT
jgi:hypothetical protein